MDTNFKRTVNREMKEGDKTILFIKGYHIRFTELDGDNYRPMTEFSKDNVNNRLPEQGRVDV